MNVDELLNESKRLRDELMRTAAKLEAFSEQLAMEVVRMRIKEGSVDDVINGAGNSGADESSQ